MKPLYWTQTHSLGAVLPLVLLLGGCDVNRTEHSHDDHGAAPVDLAGVSGVLTIPVSGQTLIGLETANPRVVTQPPELHGYGRVLSPEALVQAVASLHQARITEAAARSELARVRRLFENDNNASARALETAQAGAESATTALRAQELKLLVEWGEPLARQEDLPRLVEELARNQQALVRIEFPPGEKAGTPVSARLYTLDDPASPLVGRFLGTAPEVDPLTQGAGHLFAVENGGRVLRPGQAVEAQVSFAGSPRDALLLPASAVVRSQGHPWVYLQEGPERFTRRGVTLDHPVEEGWLVSEGLSATNRVVVTGAQLLLSQELRGNLQPSD